MLEVTIPGRGMQTYAHLVLDFNGTLARDGNLLADVAERLRALSSSLDVRVVTADTFGSATRELAGIPLQSTSLLPEERGEAKAALLESLGAERTVAVGNGSNDVAMLGRAALGMLCWRPTSLSRT